MANRYWVTGGTGNWNDTSNWSATTGGASGASVPVSIDGARFDASSGSGIATLDISPTIQNLSCAGFTGTLAFGTNTISLNSTGTIFTGSTTMTVTGTPLIICTDPTAISRTISPGAVTEANSISFRITAGTGGFTTSTGSYRDLDFTDGVNPTGFGGALGGATATIYGNFKASTNMTQNASTSALVFAATSGTKTIITAGVTFNRPFTFDGVGGTWQLQDSLTSGLTRTCTLTNGTLDLNDQTLTIGTFSSSNSNARTLDFGAGKMVLTFNAAGTVFTTAVATNLTLSGTRRVEINGVGTAGNTRTLSGGLISTGGGAPENAMDFYISNGGDTISFGTAARAYGLIDFTGFTGNTLTNSAPYIYGGLVLSPTLTVTPGTSNWTFAAGSLIDVVSNGAVLDVPITVSTGPFGGVWFRDALSLGTNQLTFTAGTLRFTAGTTNTVGSFVTTGTTQKYLDSDNPGVQATLSDASGTNSVSYLTIQDNNATGGAVWLAPLTQSNTNAGNNTGWSFPSVVTLSTGNNFTFAFGFRI